MSCSHKNESGRSMVEMLGVLAVIGVLSVAGIAGYNTAMRSYRTNEIVNAASMFYIMAMAQNAGNGPTTNVAYTDVGGTSNPSGVSTLQYNKDTKEISITFTDPDDCTMALNKLGDKATGDCPNLTVSFREITVSEPTIEEDLTLYPISYPCPTGSIALDVPPDDNSPEGGYCVKSLAAAQAYCESKFHKNAIYDEEEELYVCY